MDKAAQQAQTPNKNSKVSLKNLVHGRLEEGWVREESGGRGM